MRQRNFYRLPEGSELLETGVLGPCKVIDYLYIQVDIINRTGDDINVKIMGAVTDPTVVDNIPDFTVAKAHNNIYDYIDCYPLDNQASGPIVGSTGIVMAGADEVKTFTVSVDHLDEIAFDVTIDAEEPTNGVFIRVSGVTNQ